MRNIKKSVPYKTSDKSCYYQHCLQETCKIFLVIIHHTHYEKSDWSRAFNQFTIACELDMCFTKAYLCNVFTALQGFSRHLVVTDLRFSSNVQG